MKSEKEIRKALIDGDCNCGCSDCPYCNSWKGALSWVLENGKT